MWSLINEVLNSAFDAWLWPFQRLDPVWQIIALSLPAAIFSLLVFRYASDQQGIRSAKNKIKAYLLELRVYRDDVGVSLRAQGQVLRYTLKYMRHALLPMAIMIVPFMLILVQVESRMAFRSLEPGEQAIITVNMESQVPVSQLKSAITLPDGVGKEAYPVRIDASGEILWRIRANRPGSYKAAFNINEQVFEKQIIVGGQAARLAPSIYRGSDIRTLGYPAEPALESNLAASSVTVAYPRSRGEFAGLSSASWLLFLFTMVFGFMFRGVMGVTF